MGYRWQRGRCGDLDHRVVLVLLVPYELCQLRRHLRFAGRRRRPNDLLWISTIVVLLGAELNAEIEHQTARDSTIGAEKPLGARGAVMADTVGAKQA